MLETIISPSIIYVEDDVFIVHSKPKFNVHENVGGEIKIDRYKKRLDDAIKERNMSFYEGLLYSVKILEKEVQLLEKIIVKNDHNYDFIKY